MKRVGGENMFYTLDLYEKNGIREEDIYRGFARRPAFILRGSRVTQEQAFEIISHEGAGFMEPQNPDIRCIASNHEIRLHREPGFSWIRTWIDTKGNIGGNSFTYKYPDEEELLLDNLAYAGRYPYLAYVIIYSTLNEVDWDVYAHHDGCIAPFCDITIGQIMEAFSYAVWVHDGGAEVVDKKRAKELYDRYNAEYEDEKLFCRDDWDCYVEHLMDEAYLKRLNEVWQLREEEFERLLKICRERRSVREETEDYRESYCGNYMNRLKRQTADTAEEKKQRERIDRICSLRREVIDAIEKAVRDGTFTKLDLAPYWERFMEIPTR